MDIRIDKSVTAPLRKPDLGEPSRVVSAISTAAAENPDLAPEKQVALVANSQQAGLTGDIETDKIARALVRVLSGEADVTESEATVKRLNEIMREREHDLEFAVDDVTGRNILRVLHSQSGDLIRQFPEEEAIRVARFIKAGPGALLDSSA